MLRNAEDLASQRRSAFELLLGLAILGVILTIGGLLLAMRSGVERTASTVEGILQRLESLENGQSHGARIEPSAREPVELQAGEYLIIELGPSRSSSDNEEAETGKEVRWEEKHSVEIRRAADDGTVGEPLAVTPATGTDATDFLFDAPLLGFVSIPEDGRYAVTPVAGSDAALSAAARPTALALLPSTQDEFEAARIGMRSIAIAILGGCGMIVGPIVVIACGIPALVVRFRKVSPQRRSE